MEIQREKSQEDSSNEILEMIKILWNERENQKQKDQVIELDLRKNHQELQHLQKKLIQFEEEVLSLRREKAEQTTKMKLLEEELKKMKEENNRLIPLNKIHPETPTPKDCRPVAVCSALVKLLENRRSILSDIFMTC